MINTQLMELVLFFINPFNVLGLGWMSIIDVLTFFIIPYIFLQKIYKVVWWRAGLFYIGFMLTQISFVYAPITEYMLEIAGIFCILYSTIGRKNDNN